MRKILIAFLVILLVSAVMFSGCTKPDTTGGTGGTDITVDSLERYDSYESLVAAFDEARNKDYGYYRGGLDMIFTTGDVMESQAVGAADSGAKAADSYSETNVQVEGVDEADIVKTDGKYIYVFGTLEDSYSYNSLIILDAYPIDNAEIVSVTETEDISPTEMFVNGDKLVIFGTKSQKGDYDYGYRCFGCGYGGSFVAQVYDISDRAYPEMIKEVEADGYYLTSRMIGNDVYFVVNSYPHWDVYPMPMPMVDIVGDEMTKSEYEKNEGSNKTKESDYNSIIPTMKIDGVEMPIADATKIGMIPYVDPTSFVTIFSLNVESLELNEEVVAASGESVYSSTDNLFLAESSWFYDEVEIDTNGDLLAAIGAPIVKMIAPEYWNYNQQTIVSKFKLDGGNVSFVAAGAAPGRILNQFSMDEFEGNFRIATTTGQSWGTGNNMSANNIYIFNEGMEMIGSLEDLAPGEQIYSARFMGKKGYIVTFKKVDPLFVIDLEDPTNPNVLGKLKIPGYSDYLHPIDETHLIGLGKDSIESTYGDFAWYQGIKMAIFDVSDVSNPIEMHKIIIGDRGTDSYALQDHKAFLFDNEKKLLVIPITLAEISEEEKNRSEEERWGPSYGEYVYQGAFVFDISLESGISERGRISHVTEKDELKRGYYYGDDYSVKRSLYIDDVLFTISNNTIKANDLNTLDELKSFNLE